MRTLVGIDSHFTMPITSLREQYTKGKIECQQRKVWTDISIDTAFLRAYNALSGAREVNPKLYIRGFSDLSVEVETASISVKISTKVEPPTVALEVSL